MNLKRAFLTLLATMFVPGLAFAQIDITARFETFMNFADENPVPTSVVHRECNTGLPLNQFFEMGNNGFVEFIATLLPAEQEIFYCSITAADVPNYTAWYSEMGGNFEITPCDWTGLELDVLDWTVNCKIKMVPDRAKVTVSKDWVTPGAGGDAVKFHASVIASSSDELAIVGSYPCHRHHRGDGFDGDSENYCLNLEFHGEDPSNQIFWVNTGYLGETIQLRERVRDSSVVTTNTCGDYVKVFPGGEGSCGFVNTVFFEGIPTLSQYGLAIMALLMLGVGFVGFRRFV